MKLVRAYRTLCCTCRFPALGLLAFLVWGCSSVPDATPTPYQAAKAAGGYGYSSVQLADNQYRVMFRATEATDAAMVQEYALYRAAQVAKDNGYQWLSIIKTDVERKKTMGKSIVKNTQNPSPAVMQDSQCSMSGCSEVGQPFPADSSDLAVDVQPMEDVYYSILVRMGEDELSAGDNAFNAHDILSRGLSDTGE